MCDLLLKKWLSAFSIKAKHVEIDKIKGISYLFERVKHITIKNYPVNCKLIQLVGLRLFISFYPPNRGIFNSHHSTFFSFLTL